MANITDYPAALTTCTGAAFEGLVDTKLTEKDRDQIDLIRSKHTNVPYKHN